MANVTEIHPGSIWASVRSFFAAIARGISVSAAAEARFRRIEALNAKTDAELAEMGLRRQDIPSYVFRDLMHT